MKEIHLKDIQKVITEERKRQKISTYALQQAGISNPTYDTLEKGDLGNITVRTLCKYMRLLGYEIAKDLPLRFYQVRVYPEDCL